MIQHEVAPELKRRFAEWIDARTAKGIETYGGPLTTNNGRDVQRDMREELLDFLQYQHQYILELEGQNSVLRCEVEAIDLINRQGTIDTLVDYVNSGAIQEALVKAKR